MPRVPMILALVISAPSQCDRSISSRPDTPGNRYLLPPEKPTTSCGKTGPTISVTSCSTTARLTRTRALWLEHAVRELGDPIVADRPDVREGGRIPPRVVEHGDSRIAIARGPGLVPRCAASAGSLIAAWVPNATSAVSSATRPCNASWTAESSSGRGELRVPSGTKTQTLRPSSAAASSCSRTKRADLLVGQHLVWPADLGCAGCGRRWSHRLAHISFLPRREFDRSFLCALYDRGRRQLSALAAPRSSAACRTRVNGRSRGGCTRRCGSCR